MEILIATTVIIGVIDAVKKQFSQVQGIYGIALSVVLGAVIGYFNFAGVEGVEQGIVAGISASGIYKVAKKVGGE